MKVDILGVKVDSIIQNEALKIIEGFLKDGEFHYVVTPNPEIVVYAQKDRKFAEILNKADLSIPDGIGLVWAGKILGGKIEERVTGVDLADEICKMAAKNAFTMGFLGGKSNVAVKAAKCQKEKYPGLKVLFASPGDPAKPLVEKDRIDILFVAYGFPKQEYWMAKWGQRSGVKVAIGVGGTLDYFAGRVTRTPKFLRNLGFEWLWRLIRQPWRLRRQLALVEFARLVIQQTLRSR